VSFDKSRLPSAETYFAGVFPKLKKANGDGWTMARCVFHDDRHPSLSLNVTTGAFKCLACGASGGDVLAFHIRRHNLTFEQAARDLGAWHGETSEQRQEREKARLAAQERLQRAERERRDREHQEAERASWRAQAIWYGADPAPGDHPYLVAKRLPPCGARYVKAFTFGGHALAEALVIAMRDITGRIRNVQGIGPDGSKRFLAGAPTAELFALPITRADGKWVDQGIAPPLVGVAEGWASAAAHSLVKKCPTVAAMSAGNVPAVVVALRKKWPQAHLAIAIAIDNDAAGARALGTAWGLLIPEGRRHTTMEALGISEDSPSPIYNDWSDQRLEVLRGVA